MVMGLPRSWEGGAGCDNLAVRQSFWNVCLLGERLSLDLEGEVELGAGGKFEFCWNQVGFSDT